MADEVQADAAVEAPADPNADIPGISTDVLAAEFVDLASQFVRIDNRRRAIARELDDRRKKADVQHRVAAMSEDEKAALRAALGA